MGAVRIDGTVSAVQQHDADRAESDICHARFDVFRDSILSYSILFAAKIFIDDI
jgi:hypothetical protein